MIARIEVRNRIPGMAEKLQQQARQLVSEAAFACEALAKSLAPVDTGLLRNSIQAEPETPDSWVVAPHTDYAVNVELGTSRQAAQPYLTPAAEHVRPQFLGQMQLLADEVAR